MKRLILMRHAKTEPWSEGVDDHGRALTAGGRRAARAVGQVLSDRAWVPDLALISTARRTRETWQELVGMFDDVEARFDENLYLAPERGLIDLISAEDSVSTLMVLAHNPGLYDLSTSITRLAGDNNAQAAHRLMSKLPTGGVTLFEAPEDSKFIPSGFKLEYFIHPKDLVE